MTELRWESAAEIHQERREVICATGARLFAERGYRATSIVDIADELGLTKGAIYHYFKSKAEILVAIFDEGMNLLESNMAALTHGNLSPVQLVEAALRQHMAVILDHRDKLQVVRAELRELPPEDYIRARQRAKQYSLQFIELVRAAVGEGGLPGTNPRLAALAAMSLTESVLRNHAPLEREYILETHTEMAMRALGLVR